MMPAQCTGLRSSSQKTAACLWLCCLCRPALDRPRPCVKWQDQMPSKVQAVEDGTVPDTEADSFNVLDASTSYGRVQVHHLSGHTQSVNFRTPAARYCRSWAEVSGGASAIDPRPTNERALSGLQKMTMGLGDEVSTTEPAAG
ncbi:hypothetical protein N658DRAFT_58454 [Parathielavia hyrcaniae]|uniref:Uncharacterized protein n=1 Tax=Parathielavia hyrcaniae TaxID=113614 RepID=A0AAN6Q0K1_9PEZI|nr:hypothetical protein N658DRAFT_58454 [Parathielavia hyrcaniae]